MKSIVFFIYSLFFNLRALFPPVPNRIGLVSFHNAAFNDGLWMVKEELESRGEYEFLYLERKEIFKFASAVKFCTFTAFKLGGASYIFLNDNFMPLAYLTPNKNTTVVQLWHGQGAFKKFGLDINQPPKIRHREIKMGERLNYVVCSSMSVKEIYSSAFGVPVGRVLTTGSPNQDYYFRRHDLAKLRAEFDARYPNCKGKKLVLYAPTFREDPQSDARLLSNMDFGRLCESVKVRYGGEAEVEVLLRLHPQVHTAGVGDVVGDADGAGNKSGVTDVTDYENVNELCLLADMLITDYSSICMDFVLLEKPIVFFAYDLADYRDNRDFYFDYEDYVPGPVAETMDELCESVILEDTYSARRKSFRQFNFGEPDGEATKKLLDVLGV